MAKVKDKWWLRSEHWAMEPPMETDRSGTREEQLELPVLTVEH